MCVYQEEHNIINMLDMTGSFGGHLLVKKDISGEVNVASCRLMHETSSAFDVSSLYFTQFVRNQ